MNNFTPRAQQVLALARKEADRFNHNFVGTEHLLLGLIKLGQGVAVNVLQKLGLDLETVRMEVEKAVGTGPVVVNFLLADEINRAPAKVQSALLEVMAERKISIGGKTYPLPKPFLVMATQNPIENEGVYPLPEAQRDRFLFKINVDYPTPGGRARDHLPDGRHPAGAQADPRDRRPAAPAGRRRQQLRPPRAGRLRRARRDGHPRPGAVRHARRQVLDRVRCLASAPSLGIIAAARALALVRGRDYVIPQDIIEVIPDVLRHRLVLTYDALADDVKAETVINRIMQTVALPQVNAVPQQGHSVPPVACAASGRVTTVGERVRHRRPAVLPAR